MRAVLPLSLLAGCLSMDSPGVWLPATVDQDPGLPRLSVEVAGRERLLHGRILGDPSAEALIILHGSLGDHRALLDFDVLAERYELVLFDQRGNGLSERIPPEEYTEQSIVDEIAAIKELVSPDAPVTLVGHSFGGMYAALYASRHPEDVDQMALLEPGGLTGAIFTETFRDIIDVDILAPELGAMLWQSEVLTPQTHEAIDSRVLMYLLEGAGNYYCDPESPPPLPVWRPGGVVDSRRPSVLGSDGSLSFTHDFARGLSEFPREVLLVGGSCSALGAAYQEKWHRPLFADARVVEIEGVGHRMPSEATEQVLEVLMSYLDAYTSP